MCKSTAIFLVLLGLAALPSAQAEEVSGKDLVQKYGCTGCHQPDVRTAGPSWKEVAARYSDGSKTAEQLGASIKAGGSGKWGPVPMPPQAQIPPADLTQLATWVLSGK